MSLRRSIRLRLGIAAALAILTALAVGGVVLAAMFDRQVNRLAQIDLTERSVILISGLRPAAPLSPPDDTIGGDPRYLRPFSGYYWQIDIAGSTYRAQSLWDFALPLEQAPAPGEIRFVAGDGPDGQSLMIIDRVILVGKAQVPTRIAVALDRHSFTEAQALFARDLVPFLAILGALLLATSVVQIAVGLRPFNRIRLQLSDLSRGNRARLGRDMPQEVEPLAQEIDALLDERDARLERARHRSADLAHTLKTPLQALMGEVGRLQSAGQHQNAGAIAGIVQTMRRQIDHELARDRIAGQGVSNPQKIARGVADVLSRTDWGSRVTIDVAVDPVPLRIDPQDLAEALGSLAENAMRHARSHVSIRSRPGDGTLTLIVKDDGPGIPEENLGLVTERGVSLSKDHAGDGLGLALVSEIVEANGGQFHLANTARGLQASMTFRIVPAGPAA